MIPRNVGTIDRIIRLSAGVVIFIAGLALTGGLRIGFIVIGAILFLTGLTGRCCAYAVGGWSTTGEEKKTAPRA